MTLLVIWFGLDDVAPMKSIVSFRSLSVRYGARKW